MYVNKFLLVIFLLLSLSCFKNSKTHGDVINLINESKNNLKSLTSMQDMVNWSNNTLDTFKNYQLEKDVIQYFGELSSTEQNQDFISYLCFLISDLYWQNGNNDLAVYYMSKVNDSSYSLEYDYKPIGYYIAKRIISSNASFSLKEKMLNLLLDKYSKEIDVAYTLYELSNLYKSELELNKVIEIMKRLVNLPTSELQSEEINLRSLKDDLYFYSTNKQWVYQDLQTLIKKIKYAVNSKDVYSLYKYVSKKEFSIKLFQKSNTANWSFNELNIENKWIYGIDFSDKLENYSNENEAYLKSTNWYMQYMNTWYFYFKRFDYPYDMRVNGGWEWAGIYFGEPY